MYVDYMEKPEIQIISMTADYNGYTPNAFYVQSGKRPISFLISTFNNS